MTTRLKVFLIFSIIGIHACIGSRMSTQDMPALNFSIPVSCKKVVVDKLQRIYVISKDNSVNVFDQNNQLLFRYSNRRIGAITHIDVSNPIKILLYCKDFGRVVILDNTLSEVQEFILSDFGFSDVSVVATANDQGYWLYDPLRFRLIKLNAEGNTALSSSNFTDYGIYSPKIMNIRESGNRVLLYDEEFGFLLFDNYGQYISKLALKGILSFHFDGKKIICFDGKNLLSVDPELGEIMVTYEIPDVKQGQIIDVILCGEEVMEIYDQGIIRKN